MIKNSLNVWRNIETEDNLMKKELSQNDQKLKDIFLNKLSFGTAGIRGVMGAGTGKVNEFTIAQAAQAYALYLGKTKKGIVIGHDNRHNSKLYAQITAEVMAANNINAFLFEKNNLQPTPLVSFAIRDQKLDGGVMITASHNPKEYNGFKIYDSSGAQPLPKETNKIAKLMENIDLLNVKRLKGKVNFLDQSLIDRYKNLVSNLSSQNCSNINVVFSSQHGTSHKLGPELIRSTGANVTILEKQNNPDPDFKYTKTPNPEDKKAYGRLFRKARKEKADAIITTDPDADRIGLVVRHKKRYKFLNGNDSASIFLYYKLNKMKREGKIPKNGYIVTTHVSGILPQKIAEKFGLKVYKTHVGFKNIANFINSNNKEKFIFGFEESYGSLLNASIARDKDALQTAVGYTNMVSYFKTQNTNAYKELKNLYKEFGIHRTTQISKKLNDSQVKTLIKKASKLKGKKIDGSKIEFIEHYKEEKLIKIVFSNGSWFAIRPSGTEPKVKIYIESIGGVNQKLIDIVSFEKTINEWVKDSSEFFEDKKITWKGFFKYFIFTSLIVGTLVFVFLVIYRDAHTGSKNKTIYSIAGHIMNSKNIGLWLIPFFWFGVLRCINAWKMKRMFTQQNINVRFKHLFMSSLMSSIISFITPFAIGGDAIGYWYLRRKGIKRGAVIATMMSDTLLFQAKYTLQTLILLSVGIPIYRDIFASGDPEAHAALIWFIIGLSWTLFATFMIFLLSLNKRIQEWIVSTSIKLLEWSRFFLVSDPGSLAATYQYEFKQMREGMKTLWMRWWFPIEMIFYSFISIFVQVPVIIMFFTGWIPESVSGVNGYIATIVVGDISSTANSMSITPGGSGTGEWLNIVTKQMVYKHANYSSRGIAAAYDFLSKVLWTWPWLLLSMFSVFSIIFRERNKDSKKNKIKRKKHSYATK